MPRKAKSQTRIDGFGCIFQPRYRDRKGALRISSVWWMEYKAADGNKLRRSTGQTQQTEAFAELMKVAGKRANGHIVDTAPERIRIDQLLDLLIKSYANKHTLYDLTLRVNKYLRPNFGSKKAVELRKSDLEAFADQLQKGKKGCDDTWIQRPLSDASVNRCLANLHRAFTIGAEEDPPLVLRIPKFPYRIEDNARMGILGRQSIHPSR